jgi:predicted dehydrogenase
MHESFVTFGRRLRLGMVGGGFDSIIGETHRIAFQADGHYELVAGAFSVDPKVCEATGKALFIPPDRNYTDYREMAAKEAARPDGIDVVVIATPPGIHKDVAKTFLAAGIHVICEKPLTRTVEEALELQQAVETSGKIFVLTHCYSGFPMVRHARDLVASGALGKIRLIDMEFAGGSPGVSEEPSDPSKRHWRFQPANGKEMLLGEVGSHAYHMMRYVTGMTPSRLSAVMQTFVPRREVYDNAYLNFEFADGAAGRLWTSYVATGTQHGLGFRIYGDKAALEWHEEDGEYLRFRPLREPESILRAGQDDTSSLVAYSARFRPGHTEGYALAFANIYREAALAIIAAETGGSSEDHLKALPSVADGVAGVQMIAAAAASNNQDGKWVSLP